MVWPARGVVRYPAGVVAQRRKETVQAGLMVAHAVERLGGHAATVPDGSDFIAARRASAAGLEPWPALLSALWMAIVSSAPYLSLLTRKSSNLKVV